jgi:redox-sensitive bicupin YhaK (pirin superfamily)
MIKRRLKTIETPPAEPGFLGKGHTARAVVHGHFSQSDPFILLMDDMLDKQDGEPAGGPHPHAGFETVTLLLEGEIGDARHRLKDGDLQLMTAGSGIIHSETINTEKKMRLLQLWISLPKKDRWTEPRVQDIPLEHVPLVEDQGAVIRIYSGTFAGVNSPVRNYASFILADIQLQPGAQTMQQIPASFNAFLYVIDGSLQVGEDRQTLNQAQVGWLDRSENHGPSELLLNTGEKGARLVLYAGEPTHDEIISYGPFIGDSQEDIKRLYKDFRDNKMQHIASVTEQQILMH